MPPVLKIGVWRRLELARWSWVGCGDQPCKDLLAKSRAAYVLELLDLGVIAMRLDWRTFSLVVLKEHAG